MNTTPAVCFSVLSDCGFTRVYFHGFHRTKRVPIFCSPLFQDESEELFKFCSDMSALPTDKIASLPIDTVFKALLKMQVILDYDETTEPWEVRSVKPNDTGTKILWPLMRTKIVMYWLPGYGKRSAPPPPDISLADAISKMEKESV